jgi:hypothetical protein
MITNVDFGSYAKRIGLDVGYDVVAVVEKAPQLPTAIPIAAGFAAAAAIAALQFARRRAAATGTAGVQHGRRAADQTPR